MWGLFTIIWIYLRFYHYISDYEDLFAIFRIYFRLDFFRQKPHILSNNDKERKIPLSLRILSIYLKSGISMETSLPSSEDRRIPSIIA